MLRRVSRCPDCSAASHLPLRRRSPAASGPWLRSRSNCAQRPRVARGRRAGRCRPANCPGTRNDLIQHRLASAAGVRKSNGCHDWCRHQAARACPASIQGAVRTQPRDRRDRFGILPWRSLRRAKRRSGFGSSKKASLSAIAGFAALGLPNRPRCCTEGGRRSWRFQERSTTSGAIRHLPIRLCAQSLPRRGRRARDRRGR
jgi:hypothetical protein